MRYNILLVSGLAMGAILLTVGCGKNTSDTQPVASVGGEKGGQAASKGRNSSQSDYDQKHPQVAIETSLGKIMVQLDGEKSPLTVDNFLAYVQAGMYDQTIFHQVYKNQAVLAGGYTTNWSEIRARIPVSNEAHNGLKNRRGTIAMFRQIDSIDNATSQFFINVADNDAMNYRDRTPEGYGYCVFGEVISGMEEVVDKIANVQVEDTKNFDSTPVQAVVIKSIQRVK